jgi:propionyl-CoA carboxylase alpha chain
VVAKLLVANRGEIARRIFRTCRQMGIGTVAVFAEPDRSARFVAEADWAVALGGTTATESYLDIEKILEAAHRSGAEAIHPGYGFLAENAGFARAVLDTGLIWVGPPPAAIEAMGSKLESKRLMIAAGVPTLPSIDVTGLEDEALKEAGQRIGFPLLVKASAGGGGKGMRVVDDQAGLVEAAQAAAREAISAFGDGTIFLERYLTGTRHIEIQVFADDHDNTVSLLERECSIQRRHQKIIEEAPSPVIDPDTRFRMGEAAVAAARVVGYRGAGTVEFLFYDGQFHFLEMNTRLQVEHPVTEVTTGLDLVRLQIMVALGEPLPPEALAPGSTGHAIEARLYAEDPRHGFLPATGTLDRFRFAESEGIRVDSGVEDGSEIGPHYDPLLAKVIAWGANREEAAARLATALTRAEIHGSVTNRDLLVRILQHPEFLSGVADTGFLDRHDPAQLGRPMVTGPGEEIAALAAVLCARRARLPERRVASTIPAGFRNNPSQPEWTSFDGAETEVRIGVRFDRTGEIHTNLEGRFRIVGLESERVGIERDGLLGWYQVHRVGSIHHVDGPDGYARLVEQPRFPTATIEDQPGSLHAPMPGKVIAVPVAEGDKVEEGQTLVVMEAMKMEHTLRAPFGGHVSAVGVSIGDQVDAHQVLVIIEA